MHVLLLSHVSASSQYIYIFLLIVTILGKLKIVGHPQPWGATRNEVVTFTTFAVGKGTLTFVWEHNGKQIPPSDDNILQEDCTSVEGSKSTIRLTFNPEIHKGRYQCFVRSKRSGPIGSNCVQLRGKYIFVCIFNEV